MSILDKFKKEQEQPQKKSVAKAVAKTEEKSAPKKAAKKETSATAKKAKANKKGISRLSVRTLVRPLVSEKSAQLSASDVLVFEIHRDANRVAVKQAFKEVYGVRPEKVNIVNVRGKNVRFGRRFGKRNDIKKAFIFLPKGTNVDVFEGV